MSGKLGVSPSKKILSVLSSYPFVNSFIRRAFLSCRREIKVLMSSSVLFSLAARTQPAMSRYLIRAADAITGFSPNTDFHAENRPTNMNSYLVYPVEPVKVWFLRGWENEKIPGKKRNSFRVNTEAWV